MTKEKIKYVYDWEKLLSWIAILLFCITSWMFVIKCTLHFLGI
mgnify:CR=1 FL=1